MSANKKCLVLLQLCAAFAMQSTTSAQVTFTRMDVPDIFVTSMSADGHWIVGTTFGSNEIYRYHVLSQTYQFLSGPSLPFGLPDVSDDGMKVVGNVENNSGIDFPSVWTDGIGWEQIPVLTGTIIQDGSTGGSFGISGDGSTVSGLFNVNQPVGAAPFHWSTKSGTVELLTSGEGGRASRVNADGSVFAGFDHDPVGGFRRSAVWVDGVLTVLSHDRYGDAEGINNVGDVLVGQGDRGFGEGAMMWSWDGSSWTATNLGTLPGTDPLFYNVSGLDVSTDGSIVVGVNRSGNGPFAEANGFMWTQADGMVNIEDFLASNGVDLHGFDIQVASAISDDGTVISGWGINPTTFRHEGWWISMGPSCPADLTGDGSLNFFDVSAFLSAFSAGESVADFTGDGQFNFFDVSAFLAAFSAGCP